MVSLWSLQPKVVFEQKSVSFAGLCCWRSSACSRSSRVSWHQTGVLFARTEAVGSESSVLRTVICPVAVALLVAFVAAHSSGLLERSSIPRETFPFLSDRGSQTRCLINVNIAAARNRDYPNRDQFRALPLPLQHPRRTQLLVSAPLSSP